MAKSCILFPKEQYKRELFLKLNDNLGRDIAAKVYNRVITDEFINKYKDSLTLVGGIPTYSSVMNNPAVRKFIGDAQIVKLSSKQPVYDDNLDNVTILLNKMDEFNNDAEHNNLIAYIDYTTDGQLTLVIDHRNAQTIEIAQTQQKINTLNQRIAELLTPAGVTVDILSDIETSVGRVGVTNFNHLSQVVGNFADLIKIANNMEGFNALSEEFAHLVVGINRNNTLVSRSINALKNNEDALKQILGNHYQDVYDYFNGNMDDVAEEALGHLLKESLLEGKKPEPTNIFTRAINYIVNRFKGYNPNYITSTLDYVSNNMNELAAQYLDENKKITRKDIVESEREKEFNALSDRAQIQLDKLKKIAEDAYKRVSLLKDVDDEKKLQMRREGKDLAYNVENIIKKHLKKEETVVAIYEYLKLATKDLKSYNRKLEHLKEYDRKQQSIILRNVEFTLQAYEQAINELSDVLGAEFLEDEHIANQLFALEDSLNDLRQFESTEEEEKFNYGDKKYKGREKFVAKQIEDNSKSWKLSKDGKYYRYNKTGEKALRVTTVISSPEERMDEEHPYSTNIGTGIDEMVRDFLSGEIIKGDYGKYTVRGKALHQVYPNATEEALNSFADSLYEFKEQQEAKGITLLSRDVTVSGDVQTVDSSGKPHTIKVAGTLDILGYDSKGNWYIYDIKTYRTDIDAKKRAKYTRQISLYKKLLEDKYGIKVKEVGILPVKVSYPKPSGDGGTANYDVDLTKPREYNGVTSNQLRIDGELFKGANPKLESLDTNIKPEELNISYESLSNSTGEPKASILASLDAASKEFRELRKSFNDKSFDHVKDLFTGVLGETVQVQKTDRQGNIIKGEVEEVSIEELLRKAPLDNSIIQKLLVSYANNPDPYVQAMNYLIKKAKYDKHLKMIELSKKILAFGKKYENLGIKSYDWMFEDDKQNYINHIVIDGRDYSYDGAAYKKAKQDYVDELNKKYGEHPEIGSKEYKAKRKALDEWIDANTTTIKIDGVEKIIPLPSKYPSKYNSLTATQKDFYDEWMSLKAQLDLLLPVNATHLTNTIKIRKTGYQRLTSSNENIIKSFVEKVKSDFIKSYDDDLNYNKTSKDFRDNEVNKLPLFYLHADNASDITTDVIGSLIAYADMAYTYDSMNDIVDSLELAKDIAKRRKVAQTSGKLASKEKIPYKGGYIENPLFKGDVSNFLNIVNNMLDSKVYGKYLIDRGTIGDTKVDKQKAASILLKLGSSVQLGFNMMAWIANFLTGRSMQRIDAIAGEHFNWRELHEADAFIMKQMPAYLGDVGQRFKKSKLALLEEMFDFRQNGGNMRNMDFMNRNFLIRIFGPRIQFIGQDMGDMGLYDRSGCAILKRYKLKDKDGSEISLLDALEEVPVDPNHPEYGNKLQLKEGVTKLDGTPYTNTDKFHIKEEIGEINRHDFGIYNTEDSLEARRYIMGRFLLQYRDFIPAQYQYRFAKRSQHITKGGISKDFEGYYRTYVRFLKSCLEELKAGEFRLAQVWDQLDDWEKANIIRARAETVQLLMLYMIGLAVHGLADDDDDKETAYVFRLFNYMIEREKTELGFLAPASPYTMAKETLNIIKSPMAASNVIGDIVNLGKILYPPNHFDEIESSRYKGHSTAYRAFMESPATLWYRTIRRQLEPERAMQFYKD